MQLFRVNSINLHSDSIRVRTIKSYAMLTVIGITYLLWYRLTGMGIPCLFHLVTGLYCPGCGISRMFIELSKFDIYDAFRSNCFVFLLMPYGIFVWIRHLIYILRYDNFYQYKKYHRIISYVVLIMAILFGILRNISYFDFLGPL